MNHTPDSLDYTQISPDERIRHFQQMLTQFKLQHSGFSKRSDLPFLNYVAMVMLVLRLEEVTDPHNPSWYTDWRQEAYSNFMSRLNKMLAEQQAGADDTLSTMEKNRLMFQYTFGQIISTLERWIDTEQPDSEGLGLLYHVVSIWIASITQNKTQDSPASIEQDVQFWFERVRNDTADTVLSSGQGSLLS